LRGEEVMPSRLDDFIWKLYREAKADKAAAFQAGAAVAFGLMGMAEAIQRVHGHAIKACPICGMASRGWCGWPPNMICLDCDNRERAMKRLKPAHPYR
jgi:hypothetical protein